MRGDVTRYRHAWIVYCVHMAIMVFFTIKFVLDGDWWPIPACILGIISAGYCWNTEEVLRADSAALRRVIVSANYEIDTLKRALARERRQWN